MKVIQMQPCRVLAQSSLKRLNHLPKAQKYVNFRSVLQKRSDQRPHSKLPAIIHAQKSKDSKQRVNWNWRSLPNLWQMQGNIEISSHLLRWSIRVLLANSLSGILTISRTLFRRQKNLIRNQLLREAGNPLVPCNRFRWRLVVRAQNTWRHG